MSDVIKRCQCEESKWTKCGGHAWYMSPFRFGGELFRDSVTEWALVVLGETITTRTDADRVAEIMRTRIRAGAFVKAKTARSTPRQKDAPAVTLSQLIAAYDRDELSIPVVGDAIGCSDDELANHRFRLHRLESFDGYGDRPIGAIDPAALVAFRVSPGMREQGASSWAKYRSIYDRLFRYAVRTGAITGHPFAQCSETQAARLGRTKQAGRTRRLKAGEDDRLLHACRYEAVKATGQLIYDLIVAALECAGRVGELLALRWSDIDLPTAPAIGTLTFRAKQVRARKTKAPRVIPISARLHAILVRRRVNPLTGHPYPETGYVFGDLVGGKVSPIGVHTAWTRVVIRSVGGGVEYQPKRGNLTPAAAQVYADAGLHFHDLRRECASRWLESGVKGWTLRAIQKALGHSNIAQTSTYLELADGSLLDAMRDLNTARAADARVDVAVGSTDHTAITTDDGQVAPAAGPRLVKGSKSRAGKGLPATP